MKIYLVENGLFIYIMAALDLPAEKSSGIYQFPINYHDNPQYLGFEEKGFISKPLNAFVDGRAVTRIEFY